MKLSWNFILSSVFSSAVAASSTKFGHIYTWDSTTKASAHQPPSLSPEIARLILAQRLGLSQYHTIRKPNDELVQHLNHYGGRRQQLFGGDRDRNNAHALVWIEDVQNIEEVISNPNEYSSFTLSSAPSPSENNRLIEDIIAQAESLPKKADPNSKTYNSILEVGDLMDSIKETTTHNDYLMILHASTPNANTASTLSTLLKKAQAASFSLTIVLMPPESPKNKRSANPYGTYDVPQIGPRREKPEALLSPASSESSSSPENVSANNVGSVPLVSQANKTNPVLGILPRCFESEAVCKRETNNCTGHGSCKVSRQGEHNVEGGRRDCYSCECLPTVLQGPNGKKKTYWGGPACQKKDVSVPFWLFLATGVTLLALVGGGITLLYSMGSEELPSVIGAGVSGPTRK